MREFSHINNPGKRYTKCKGQGFMKNKPRKRDRKSTLVLRPCHSDLKSAIDSLIAGKIPEGVIARIAIESASAALSLVDGTAKIDDPDDETSEGNISDDEVSVLLITFFKLNLMGFPRKLCMIRVKWRRLRVYFLYKLLKFSSENQLFAKKINLIWAN